MNITTPPHLYHECGSILNYPASRSFLSGKFFSMYPRSRSRHALLAENYKQIKLGILIATMSENISLFSNDRGDFAQDSL